ncbi:hypothetical protein SAMN05192569_10206 [Parageobacillus thermantarcticus]|uniref:Uncharacterized protein n=1 Tax=Parageobacillus thermantarcticus TaxID=186116 RepID=A0A1I0TBZ5_9BACL|nr:hypothetical protein [Parageobacillus thermantarcticus]SFA49103.1 hypothetical protein SAMN05192569_10206 [Parageobacillus thermantarcticus]
MELVALGYFGIVLLLLWGAAPAQKRWIGGTFALLVAIFVIGSLWIRHQTGFFRLDHWEWQKAGGSISLGKWAVPSYLVFAFLLFLLILISLYSENDGGSCGSAGMAVYFRHFLFAHLRRRLPCVIFHHVFFFRLRRDAVGNAQEKTPWT